MQSLIEKIKSGALWTFPGGVHPAENKSQSLSSAVVRSQIPNEIILPIRQHIGKPGLLTVSPGEKVLKGQALTKYDSGLMLPIHAPTSGQIVAIEPRTTAHPSGLSEVCIVLKPDHSDTWTELETWPNFAERSPEEIIEKIRMLGISGMGGAGFPTAKKVQSGLAKTEVLIVNAAECEPYITADDMLMRTYADELIKGIEIVEHILKPKLTVIGIEDNKPEAIRALEIAAEDKDIVIRVIPTKYPSGGEKQLIKVLTNLEVPSNGIPADIGILVQNVGSLYAIKRAVINGEPLVERIVTLTGNTFKKPRNVWALLGTPVQSLLDEFGYTADKKLPRLIMGGPMMGFTLPHSQVPITKTSNCILAPTRREISSDQNEMACIRCSACADACPASLLPQQLQWYAKAKEYEKCEELHISDCIECGACAFVCPSEIPLVQYYRQAKAEIRTNREEKEAAERAKLRFEEKKARLERDKEKRENRFKKAAESRRKEMASEGNDAVSAAIARVKAKNTPPSETPNSTKPAVAAAIARAKAKQAAALEAGMAEPDNSEMSKLREERKQQARAKKAAKADSNTSEVKDSAQKDAVAAAIARAKARKAEQENTQDAPAPDTEDPKKTAVAAAIARAKARKAEQESAQDAPAPVTEDPKKAAVAAAIARAKARKAEQESAQDASAPDTEDPKKAAVSAAIARAKARKAEQESAQDAPAPDTEDPKKAAVAAAIARAKARKAEQESAQDAPAPDAEDPKKAAVAAAIARAKARKAQQQGQTSLDKPSEEKE